MGLTSSSTGKKISNENLKNTKEKTDYMVALSGNPNVRKIKHFQQFNRNASTYW